MKKDELALSVAHAREHKMNCRWCGAVRPLFEWALEHGFVAPMPAPGQPVRREDEVPASAGRTNLICRMCNGPNWVPAHPMKDVLTQILLLPEEALGQIFAKRIEARASDRYAKAV